MKKQIGILLIILFTMCKEDKNKDNNLLLFLFLDTSNNKNEIVKRYADLAYRIYSETYDKVLEFQNQVNDYINFPTDQNKLLSVREKWKEARQKYLLTEVLRFSNGPIDNLEILSDNVDGNPLDLETLINAWPLDEQFNECYLIGSNLIGGSGCTQSDLSEQSLLNFNLENDKEENVATGWHPLEYLLWGKDEPDATKEPGRGITQTIQYFTGDSTFSSRRRMYLSNATKILVTHIKMLRDAWDPSDSNSYYYVFIKDPDNSLKNMITGFASFTKNELAAERFNGIDTRDQEDEHSCFSDTTNQDFYYDTLGVKIFYTGDYNGEEGIGLDSISTEYENDIQAHLDLVLQSMDPDKAPAYDVVIVYNAPGRNQIHEDQYQKIKFEVRPALNYLGFSFVNLGRALGYSIVPITP